MKNSYVSLFKGLGQKGRVEKTLQTQISERVVQLDNNEVELLDGSEALQMLKKYSLRRLNGK